MEPLQCNCNYITVLAVKKNKSISIGLLVDYIMTQIVSSLLYLPLLFPLYNNYVSSSINFLIYCSVGEKFKAVVKKIYLKRGQKIFLKNFPNISQTTKNISVEDNNITEAETSSEFPKRNPPEVSVLVTLSDSSCPAQAHSKQTTSTVVTKT